MPHGVIPVHFPTLARTWGPYEPSHSMRPDSRGPLFRDMLNMRVQDGVLKRREAVDRLDPTGVDKWGIEIPGSVQTKHVPTGESADHAQIPRLIKDFEISDENGPVIHRLVVTSREIYYQEGATWRNVTPEHKTGTVSITNGTKALVGVSTAWLVRGIHNANAIELPDASGNWYSIASVDTATTITLANNFEGTTISGGNYRIRRTFTRGYDGSFFGNCFAYLFLGDLYVAGDFGHVLNGIHDGVVLRYADAEGGGVEAPNVEWMFGGKFVYETGLDNVGPYVILKGMQIMQDGRILLGGGFIDTAIAAKSVLRSGNSRIWYSSNANLKVWTTAPGGAFDIPATESELTAIGTLGGFYTIHFLDKIELGVPTGIDDPPLAIQGTNAEVGTVSPMALKSDGKVEVFPSRFRQIHWFDGQGTNSFSDSPRKKMDPMLLHWMLNFSHADIDPYRRTYRLFLPYSTTDTAALGSNGSTREIVIHYETGELWPNRYSVPIGASQFSLYHSDTANEWARDKVAGIVGVPNRDDVSNADRSMLCVLHETLNNDASPLELEGRFGVASNWGGVFAETDDLDFVELAGLEPGRDCHIDHITVWYKDTGTGQDMLVGVSSDVGTTFTYKTQSVPAAGSGEFALQFFFGKQMSNVWRVRIASGTTTPLMAHAVELIRMTVWIVPGAPLEANA